MRSVIHEIRNHLAIAIANVEAFRDGVLEASPARLTAVLQALGEVDVLLRDVPTDGSPSNLHAHARTIDVCSVVANEVLAFEATAQERGIAFSVQRCEHPDRSCTNFSGDPLRVAEIVNNVMSNAMRYTPRGGAIDVDCRRGTGVLSFRVTDGGPGVRADEAEHIFDSGFRGSAAGETQGTGEGLALVRRFVEEHGGSVSVENVAGRGAAFQVLLPTDA